jgi:hypothetical protein
MKLQSLSSGIRKKGLLCGGLLLLAILVSCAFFRISHPRDVEAYFGMVSECHPVWRQFAFRHFGAGDSASNLFQRFPPSRHEEFGRYGVYRYHQGDYSNGIPYCGLSVVTRDGKLLSAGAGSCTWRFSFFQTQDAELDREYAAFMKERHETFERQRLARLETELRQFYLRHSRWPTNQREFSFFVTGSRSRDHNDLGITLTQRPDGVVDIALVELPGEKRSVTKPRKDNP